MEIVRLADITSTNEYLLGLNTGGELCAVAEYQSAGKGMGTNTWESEAGKNLLFSILIHPTWLPIAEQYLMSMAEALALYYALRDVLQPSLASGDMAKLTIKWPNDIYWEDRKLSGTRIDVNLQGGVLQDMVIGTGINVNQDRFNGTAPNPVSLRQVTGMDYSRNELLDKVLTHFEEYMDLLRKGEKERIMGEYHEHLYRRDGYHKYADSHGEFEAKMVGVAANGIMTLQRKNDDLQQFDFKEVRFVLGKG